MSLHEGALSRPSEQKKEVGEGVKACYEQNPSAPRRRSLLSLGEGCIPLNVQYGFTSRLIDLPVAGMSSAQHVPEIPWHSEDPALVTLLWEMFGLGSALVLASTFAIDHFHFTGLSQTHAHLKGKPAAEPRFVTPLLYRLVRHPMMSGLLLGIWPTPTMTVGHLLFAGAFTAYMLVGIYFEERALLRRFGTDDKRSPAFQIMAGRVAAPTQRRM